MVFPISESENNIHTSNPSVDKDTSLSEESSPVAIQYPQSSIVPAPTLGAFKTVTVTDNLGKFVTTPWCELLIERPIALISHVSSL